MWWKVALATMVLTLQAGVYAAASDEFAHVQIKGTLSFDPQTGPAISSNGQIYNLDFGGSQQLGQLSRTLNQQTVQVDGSLWMQQAGPKVTVDRIYDVTGHNVVYDRSNPDLGHREKVIEERRYVEPRDRIIIKEEKPLFKAGPLEIK
ncbi:MAG TPA: hypothetical protein VGP72_26525 [Planctomycetota bacterium]|jgi:hypothetical protein